MNAPLTLDTSIVELINGIAAGEVIATELPADTLRAICEHLNAEYRAGRPLVPDAAYDELYIGALREIDPENDFLNAVEPEGEAFDGPTVRHQRPMLSTDKAYTAQEVQRFIERVTSAAQKLGISAPLFRVTPKLDGMACRDEGNLLVTRGDGASGTDITRILERGALIAGGERSQGDGEIVVVQDFFTQVLKPDFGMEHPRNFITGFCGADTLKEHHRQAVEAKAVVFVPYRTLQAWTGTAEQFLADWRGICDQVKASVPYLTDGAIIEAVDPALKAELGATSHHHRWMLAVKEKGETAITPARDITWQTGRTGRVTPVVELQPIYLSGATLSRVTAHHAGNVKALGIGPGAELEIIRSGEVIAKIVRVVTPVEAVLPTECPCCGHALESEGDFLVCPNTLACSAQAETGLIHFFKTLANIDGYGPRTVEVLVKAGITDLREIYALTEARLQAIGFGPGQSANLVRELDRSRRQEIEDWRFLAAFGVRHLGRGDSRRLLTGFTLESLAEGIAPEAVQALDGFGAVTSTSICADLAERAELIATMLPMFTLRRTGAAAPATPSAAVEASGASGSVIAGKNVVFTGTMTSGSRDDMENGARALGANVQSSVNGKTNYLICGAKVGASKTEKAAALGVTVITEAEYLAMIG
ncbi:helix-hairpin-helix domain-containing protein [Geopseudomonas aromaticivorans]